MRILYKNICLSFILYLKYLYIYISFIYTYFIYIYIYIYIHVYIYITIYLYIYIFLYIYLYIHSLTGFADVSGLVLDPCNHYEIRMMSENILERCLVLQLYLSGIYNQMFGSKSFAGVLEYSSTSIHPYVDIYIYIHTYIYMYVCIKYIHIYIYVYINIHVKP